ncbi:MAG: ATP-binding protein [Bacillota bacterium]|nr:MAG: ATP-binding protein [Bacillota bacterium]
MADLSDEEAEALLYDWRFWARPKQLPPEGPWRIWLILAGRGFGKTRTGAEWVREQVERHGRRRIAIVGRTAADVRDVMVEGESGILSISPPWFRPVYEPSKRRLTWPNGAIATLYSADEPDLLRGPQHDAAWADELAAWRRPEAWDNLMFGLRLGPDPRVVVTTTPRPVKIIRDLLQDPTCVVTRGSTYENAANLAPAFLEQIISRYEGTRLGRQELYGEVLDDVPGALWQRKRIDELRVREAPELVRVVVAIDPAVTSEEGSDETGIVVAGRGVDGHAYVLADRSCRMSPDGWARRAVKAYYDFDGDRIVGEVNNGGDLVETVIRTVDPKVPYKAVRASRGKAVRAEPVAALYEQGKVHHVGTFEHLEDQLCQITPDGYQGAGSPDRADALVWALTELMLEDYAEPDILWL